MEGLDLIYSSVCNATFCKPIYDNPLHDAKEPRKAVDNFLNGKHLRIGTYRNYPLSWTERTENGTYIGRGVAFILVDILKEKFNFTYEVFVSQNNIMYSDVETEDSLYKFLINDRIDMIAAFVPMFKSTDHLVSYSTMIDEGEWRMLLKRPKESASGSGLLAPFDDLVWIFILIAVALYGPCVTLLTRLRSKLIPDEEKYIPLSPSIWFVYGAFIKQGTTLSPSANTTRVLFTTWWIFIILLSAFYTANLTAFLTLSKFTLEIQSVQDLYKKNYRWVASDMIEQIVKNPEEDIHFLYKMISDNRAKFPRTRDDFEYLNYVNDGFVFVHQLVSLEFLMYNDYIRKTRQGIPETERCTYVLSPGIFLTMRRAFVYQHKSKLVDLFDPTIKKVLYSGILENLPRLQLPDTKICPVDLQSKDRQLTNTDLLMTYYIMAVGLATAVAVFIGEMLFKRQVAEKVDKKIGFNKKTKIQPEFNISDESRPPPYESLFGKTKKGQPKKKIINGREYWVIKKENGETRLIPVRTPSALLYR